MTKANFRDVLLDRLNREGMSMRDLERSSGVPYDRIYNIKKRLDASTSIDTAMALAAGFGQTLDEFMGDHRSDDEREIINLVLQLPADLRGKLLGYGERLLDEVDSVPPKSDEDA